VLSGTNENQENRIGKLGEDIAIKENTISQMTTDSSSFLVNYGNPNCKIITVNVNVNAETGGTVTIPFSFPDYEDRFVDIRKQVPFIKFYDIDNCTDMDAVYTIDGTTGELLYDANIPDSIEEATKLLDVVTMMRDKVNLAFLQSVQTFSAIARFLNKRVPCIVDRIALLTSKKE
jgi:hypothetical protein